MSKQKVYCASTAQVWALHDAMPEHLRVADVDFISGVVHPVQKWSNKPLKTDGSAAPIPIPQDLALSAGQRPISNSVAPNGDQRP